MEMIHTVTCHIWHEDEIGCYMAVANEDSEDDGDYLRTYAAKIRELAGPLD